MTPLNLLLMFGLLLWTEEKKSSGFYLFSFIAFFWGMIVEVIGVNTSWLFGTYAYGAALGYKFMGVPWLMGIQWMVTISCSAHLLHFVLDKRKVRLNALPFALVAAFITTLFDAALEPIAMEFDYWSWENDIIPFYNYVCWFMISLLLHWMKVYYFKRDYINSFAAILFLIQFVFFQVLRIVL